jgi:hypothetical protein
MLCEVKFYVGAQIEMCILLKIILRQKACLFVLLVVFQL